MVEGKAELSHNEQLLGNYAFLPNPPMLQQKDVVDIIFS